MTYRCRPPRKGDASLGVVPCQDLSLAGAGRGIDGDRSGAFWPFWRLLLRLQRDGRSVPIVVIENVVGLLSSNKGQDFVQLSRVIADTGYNLGALVINADRFVPQSRPRLFIIAVDRSWDIAEELVQFAPYGIWQPKHLIAAYKRLPAEVKKRWLWWNLPMPPKTPPHLRELIEREPEGVEWHTAEETQRLLSLMSDANLAKVKAAQAIGKLHVGTIYKRTRKKDGRSVQRAEVRFDGISGCLRTPAGGSSRQIILVVQGDSVRSRLLSPREAARLMGLSDTYLLPARYNEAYHLMGDAVVVPVIAWIERHILRELVRGQNTKADKASQEWRASQLSLADF